MNIIKTPRPPLSRNVNDVISIQISPYPGSIGNMLASEIDGDHWPKGLQSHHWAAGTDRESLLLYSVWQSVEFLQSYEAEYRRGDPQVLATDAPDYFKIYRVMSGGMTKCTTGCIVLVTFDVTAASRQTELVDTVIGVAGENTSQQPGFISSNFHINAAGTRVINYAEFVDEQNHEAVVHSSLQGHSPVLSAIASLQGVIPKGFRRFTPLGGEELIASDDRSTNCPGDKST